MRSLVFASNNEKKLNEIRPLLPEFKVLSLAEAGIHADLPETTGTIKGNAIQKARYLYQITGFNCFSDDTGLEVNALGGLPGVDTAHYAGPERDAQRNMQKLLNALEGQMNREARFVTVIALVWEGEVFTFEGEVKGSIAYELKGTGGFGYDPVFVPEGYEQSFGELSPAIKQQISHRAEAVKKLIAWFEALKG